VPVGLKLGDPLRLPVGPRRLALPHIAYSGNDTLSPFGRTQVECRVQFAGKCPSAGGPLRIGYAGGCPGATVRPYGPERPRGGQRGTFSPAVAAVVAFSSSSAAYGRRRR
jgi:hypothetical protein